MVDDLNNPKIENPNSTADLIFISSQFSKRMEENIISAINQSCEGIALVDMDGHLLFVNPTFARQHDYHSDELVGKHLSILHSEKQMPVVNCANRQIFETGVFDGEIWHIRRDGTAFPGSMHNTLIRDGSGVPVGILGTLRDITRRKQVEGALVSANERFVAVMDSLDSVVYVADIDTHELLFINQTVKTQFGDISGQPCWNVLQSGQMGPCDFCTNHKLLDDNGNPTDPHIWEFQNTVDQEWYECHDQAISWPDGRKVRLEIATNISERKQIEAELQDYKYNLENKIKVRTRELNQLDKKLELKIKDVRKAQKTIKDQNRQLEQKNITLNELLAHLEKEKDLLEEKVLLNIDRLVKPLLGNLRSGVNPVQERIIDLINQNLETITSSFSQKMKHQLNTMSPREIEICSLIRKDLRTKEIARILNLAEATVISHRNRIRRKLGLRNTATNLATFLNSL